MRIKGIGTVIDHLTEADIGASIDLKGMKEGDYTVPVALQLPSGVSLDGGVNLTIHLKAKAVEKNTEQKG